MNAVIFSGGKVLPSGLIFHAISLADIVIAADSGADSLLVLKKTPDILIGDMDSISKKALLKFKNVKKIISPSDKDETDTELAIEYARRIGATKITVIGGTFGERLDHIIANILLPISYKKIELKFLNGLQESQLLKGPEKITLLGKKDDVLSLIPLSKVSGITTKNLKWELLNDSLSFGKARGISNVFLKKRAEVFIKKGLLLVVHTLTA